jgi:hypothetical protein
MGVKRQCDSRQTVRLDQTDQSRDNFPMPKMHTVKVSNCDPAAIFRQRYTLAVTKDSS